MKRSIEDHEGYELHKRIILESFETLEEYISLLVFSSKHQSFTLLRNKYPYKGKKNHYILWRNPLYDSLFIYEMSDVFKKVYLKNCLFFENEERLKTIKGVKHYHIMSDDIIDYRNVYALIF